jgi:exosome complex component RRP45
MSTKLKKPLKVSNIEENFINESIKSNLRTDGRSNFDFRNINITFENNGHTVVQIGKTKAMGVVTCDIVEPYPERPTEGFLLFNTELSPMGSEEYDTQKRSEKSIEISRIIERSLRGSKSIDTEALCIIAGKKVWSVRVDIHVIDDFGNTIDAAHLAAISSLLHFKRPDVTVQGEEYKIHSIEERNAVPLSIHHIPICVSFAFFLNGDEFVVDPDEKEISISTGNMTIALNTQAEVCGVQKGGGIAVDSKTILQCTKLAANKSKEITLILQKALKQNEQEEKLKKLPEYAKENSKHKIMVEKKKNEEIELSTDSDEEEENEFSDFQKETKEILLSGGSKKKKTEKMIEMNEFMKKKEEKIEKEKPKTVLKKKIKKNQQKEDLKDLSMAIKKK